MIEDIADLSRNVLEMWLLSINQQDFIFERRYFFDIIFSDLPKDSYLLNLVHIIVLESSYLDRIVRPSSVE